MIEFVEQNGSKAQIRIVGVGGAGGNAVNTMITAGLSGVDFIAANTDAQALRINLASTKVQLGGELTKGLGAGANPEIGRRATIESEDEIRELLSGADMVFVTSGMGEARGLVVHRWSHVLPKKWAHSQLVLSLSHFFLKEKNACAKRKKDCVS